MRGATASDERSTPAQDGARPTSLQLGLWAPTLREQGFDAVLDPHDVDHFTLDDQAISRLHVRGLLTFSEHVKARERLAKKIKGALR